MNKKEIYTIIVLFLLWKLLILSYAIVGQYIFPLQTNFLGGGFSNYIKHPLFWGFVNFDGEHYLSIAQNGYLPLTYFYFPLYPAIVHVFASAFGGGFYSLAFSGLFLSNVFILIALFGIYKLAKLYFSSNTAFTTIILLLLFPTAFFMGSFYNESLFLALCIWSFYFAKKKNWTPSFLLCGLATGTRLVGISLIPALFYEYYLSNKTRFIKPMTFIYLIMSGIGITIYAIYLRISTGDFLAFFHNVGIFGAQRSEKLIILPQVFYRYIFKIFPSLNYNYFPAVFMTLLELSSAVLFFVGLYYVYKKLGIGLFIYSVFSYLIPTLSGSFSSFPRYALAIFPVFMVFAFFLSKKSRPFRYLVYSLLSLVGLSSTMLFIRGYFVA